MRLIEDLGMQYPTENSKSKKRYAVYECPVCKERARRDVATVKTRKQEYCLKCSRTINPPKRTHGKTNTPTYKIWKAMRARCSTSEKYKRVSVCERWNSYELFLEDMGFRPTQKHSIDRIDNDGNYEPSNCRWATNDIQTSNQGLKKTNTSGFTGVYKNGGGWCSCLTVNKDRVYLGTYKSKTKASEIRDKYILNNKLPHRLNEALT